ncbi:hypothetical protein PEBR_32001 [Penicillium brasilianum]|uniref:Cell wall protein n=1 Tax=Penicillium brasilianum TaxID=104259 RepID=A0A1S9RF41_PENBI|nr:hypothetical protein PEBR_32001 [Penicillium brasilianum]
MRFNIPVITISLLSLSSFTAATTINNTCVGQFNNYRDDIRLIAFYVQDTIDGLKERHDQILSNPLLPDVDNLLNIGPASMDAFAQLLEMDELEFQVGVMELCTNHDLKITPQRVQRDLAADLKPIMGLVRPGDTAVKKGCKAAATNVKAAVQNCGAACQQCGNGCAKIAGDVTVACGKTVADAPKRVYELVKQLEKKGATATILKLLFGSPEKTKAT